MIITLDNSRIKLNTQSRINLNKDNIRTELNAQDRINLIKDNIKTELNVLKRINLIINNTRTKLNVQGRIALSKDNTSIPLSSEFMSFSATTIFNYYGPPLSMLFSNIWTETTRVGIILKSSLNNFVIKEGKT